MSAEILDRLAAANPAPNEAAKPEVLLSEAALRDAVEARQGLPHRQGGIDGIQPSKVRHNKVLIASAAFAAGLIVGVSSMLVMRGGGQENTDSTTGPGLSGEAGSSVSAGDNKGGPSFAEVGEANLGLDEIRSFTAPLMRVH